MGIAENIVVFVILWWLVLFAVLPWGVRSHSEIDGALEDEEPGIEPGSPIAPMLGWKALITTCITVILWLIARQVIPMMMPQ